MAAASQPGVFMNVTAEQFDRMFQLFTKGAACWGDRSPSRSPPPSDSDWNGSKEERVAVKSRASEVWAAARTPRSARGQGPNPFDRPRSRSPPPQHRNAIEPNAVGNMARPVPVPLLHHRAADEVDDSIESPTRGKPFSSRKEFDIGPKKEVPVTARIGLGSTSFAHAVAAGAYTLPAYEDEEEIGMAGVAPIIRDAMMPPDGWDEPVRVHTEKLGKALGIDWTKYISRLDTQKSRTADSSPSTSGRGTASASSVSLSARNKMSYTRDGRKVDNSMRSAGEAALIERVQGHSCMQPPSATHHSVAKYIGEDGTPLITPRSVSVTPRSNTLTPRAASASTERTPRGVTPRSARGSASSNPRGSSSGSGVDGDALRKALAPAAFGLPTAAPPPAVPPPPPPAAAGVGAADAAAAVERGAPAASKRSSAPTAPARQPAAKGSISARGSGTKSAKGGGSADPAPAAVGSAAEERARLQAQLAQARQRRTAMSRPLQNALAATLDSAATHLGGRSTPTTICANWRDERYRRTHIDYRAFLTPNDMASLGDLQSSSIRMPGAQQGGIEGKSGTGTVAALQGSVKQKARRHSTLGMQGNSQAQGKSGALKPHAQQPGPAGAQPAPPEGEAVPPSA